MKPIRIGNEKPSMPTKCIDQMPVPSATEPTVHQGALMTPSVVRTRRERSSATYEANVAIKSDAATSQRLCVSVRKAPDGGDGK